MKPEITLASLDEMVARKLSRAVDGRALDTLFVEARTAPAFLPVPVPHEMLRRIVEVATLGPTSSNSQPLRVVFVESPAAKERLRPALSAGNVEKTMAAPVTAIIAADLRYYEHLPRVFPHAKYDVASFEHADRAERVRQDALTNGTLGGAYVMIVARAFGLDVGPMGGFDRQKVDAEFFPDRRFVSIWLCNLGYGDDTGLRPRNPRLPFDEIARFI